jgi:hypothetical protein
MLSIFVFAYAWRQVARDEPGIIIGGEEDEAVAVHAVSPSVSNDYRPRQDSARDCLGAGDLQQERTALEAAAVAESEGHKAQAETADDAVQLAKLVAVLKRQLGDAEASKAAAEAEARAASAELASERTTNAAKLQAARNAALGDNPTGQVATVSPTGGRRSDTSSNPPQTPPRGRLPRQKLGGGGRPLSHSAPPSETKEAWSARVKKQFQDNMREAAQNVGGDVC